MIKGHEKFRLMDENKDKEFYAEVNWNPKDDKTNNCKIIKFTFPNGEEMFVDKKYLASMLFAIGTEEEQKKLIPQKITKVRWYETVLSIKAQKDIRKGEDIIFPIKLSLPSEEKEIIGSLKKR